MKPAGKGFVALLKLFKVKKLQIGIILNCDIIMSGKLKVNLLTWIICINDKTVPFEFCILLEPEIYIFGPTKSFPGRILMNSNYLSTNFLSNSTTMLGYNCEDEYIKKILKPEIYGQNTYHHGVRIFWINNFKKFNFS